jgi:hypothetical protein
MKSILRPIGGHILDIEPLELSEQVLSLARNVNMRKGFPSRIRGRRSVYTAFPTIPYHLLNFNLNGFNWWLLFGASNIFAVETSNSTNVSIPAQTAITNPYEWSSTLLNGIPVFTNGKDGPHYWTGDTSDDALPLPGFPATTLCKFIVAFRFHLFALDIDSPSGVFNNLILWSNATEPGAVPDSWTPAADNEAGSAFLADTPGRCVAGVPLGTQLMIYKPTSFHAVEYAGQQPDNIFTVRPVVRSTGLISPHCLKTIGASQAVVGNEDVVLTDGINIRSIADNRIKQTLRNSIDETNAQNSFTIYDDQARELWVCVPEPGSQFATVAHIWDERRDNWVTRDLNAVKYGTVGYVTDVAASQIWNADAQVWDDDLSIWNEQQAGGLQRVVLAENAALYVEDVPESNLVDAVIQRLDLTFESPEQRKVTSRVTIEGTGAGLSTLFVRLGSRNSTDNSSGVQWGAYVQRKAEGNEYEVTGRFISVEVTNNTSAEPWTVTRITIEAEYDGEF